MAVIEKVYSIFRALHLIRTDLGEMREEKENLHAHTHKHTHTFDPANYFGLASQNNNLRIRGRNKMLRKNRIDKRTLK